MDLNYKDDTKKQEAINNKGFNSIQGLVDARYVREELSRIVAKNMRDYLKKENYDRRAFTEFLKTELGIHHNYPNWTKVLNIGETTKDRTAISIDILVAFSHFSGVSIEDLLMKDSIINSQKNPIEENEQIKEHYIKNFLDSFLGNYRNEFVYDFYREGDEWYKNAIGHLIENSPYNTYHLSTVENPQVTGNEILKTSVPMRNGLMKFVRKGSICCVELIFFPVSDDSEVTVNEPMPEKSGIMNFEKSEYNGWTWSSVHSKWFPTSSVPSYNGFLLISKIRNCAYCIFQGNIMKPELTFLMFRIRPNEKEFKIWNSRLCEVLTSDSEASRPTILRLLMSKNELTNDHLELILPHLKLNDSVIYLKKNLFDLFIKNESISMDEDEILMVDENDIRKAIKSEINPESILSHIKKSAINRAYNKVSRRSDENIWNLLVELGVYQDES